MATILLFLNVILGFPGGSESKESTCIAGGTGLIPGWGRPPAVGTQFTPVFLPGVVQGHGTLMSYSAWGYKESDTTE